EEHSMLVRRRRTGFLKDPKNLESEILTFLARGCATGALLDGDERRGEAQNLLTYWSNILYRLGVKKANDLWPSSSRASPARCRPRTRTFGSTGRRRKACPGPAVGSG